LTAAQGGDACSNGDVAAADGAVEAAAAGEMSVVASVVLAGQDLAVQGQGGERGGAEEELAVRAPSNTTLNVFGIKLGKSDVPQSAGSEDSVASVPRTLETDESGPAAASTHDAHSASPKQPNPFGVKLKSAAKTNSERGGAGEQRSGGVEGGAAGTHLQKSVFKASPNRVELARALTFGGFLPAAGGGDTSDVSDVAKAFGVKLRGGSKGAAGAGGPAAKSGNDEREEREEREEMEERD